MYDKNRIEDSLEFVRQMKEFMDSDDALDEFDPFADNDPDELFVNLAYHMEPEVPPKESVVQDSHVMGDSFGVPDAGVIQEQRRLAEERLRLEQEAARRKQAELERQKQLEEERRRLEEEAAKRRQAEQKRLEEERRRLEEEAAKRRQAEQKRLEEERRRLEEEAAKRKQAEQEQQKRLEEERRRLEEEAAKRRQAEQEQQKRLAEERRKLEQEAERRRQAELQEKQRQEAERKKIEEERKRLAEEQKKQEEARRQWEEERRREQEEAKRKAAELAEKKRLEEERLRQEQEEARRREAELAEKKRLEEERLRQEQEEARRREAELAEKKRLEEERLRQEQEEAKRKEAALAEKKRLEEERQRLAQEEARRKEAELAEKKRLEEERKRLAQEAERRRQAELQEKQRQEAERLKIEEERRRLAEEQKRQEQARRQLEKERQRLVEEQLQRELEEQRRVLAEQARQKAEAKAKKEAEEKERRRKLVQEEEQRKKELQAREEEQRRKEQEEKKKQEEQRLAASTQNSKLPDPATTADSPESEVELLRKRAEELKRQAEMATLEARMRQLQLEAEGISTGESIITPPTSASVEGTVANNTSSTGVAPAATTAAGNNSMPMPMLSIPGVQPGAMASGAGQQTASNQNAGDKQKLSKEEIDSIFAKELKKSGSDSSYQQRKMMLQKQAERLKRKREETGEKLPLELVKEKAVQAKDFTLDTAWKIREFVLDKMTDPENAESREKAKKIMTNVLVVMICIAAAFLVSSIVTNYVAHPTKVEGESMETTLTDGDTVIIQKLSYYFGSPDRYDVVVFPVYNSDTYFIKRVIGLPGETIQIEEGKVYINGKELEDDIYGKDEYIDDPGDAGEPITLASDEYFVLGDNRNMSTDSRSSLLGVIKKKNIAGKAWRRVLPFSKNGKVK